MKLLGIDGKEKLEEILSRDEYQVYYEDNRSLVERLLDWVQVVFNKLLEKVFPTMDISANASGVVLTVLVSILVIILLIVFYKLWQRRRVRRSYEKSVPLSDLHEIEWTYADHFKHAKEYEGKGNYQRAVRHWFLALLLTYDDIDWIRAEIWKTNGEYYAELKGHSRKGADSFSRLAPLFDEVTYGKREIKEDQYAQFKEIVEQAYEFAKQSAMNEGE